MAKRYVPMDLAFEHYAHVKQDFNTQEYVKICAELVKPRYSVMTESEGYDAYFKGELQQPDKVRVIWMHDIERPNDNFLARRMAEVEHEFGFRSSYNVRVISVIDPEWREELFKISKLGHEFQYQHEDIVITEGDQAAGIESFKQNMAYLRGFFPEIKLAFGHGVYKAAWGSDSLVRNADGEFDQDLIKACGLPPYGELYSFQRKIAQEFGEKYHYFGESRCIGGDEFADALRSCKEGDVVMFLQHPTWWSSNYDVEDLKYLMRTSVFFH